MIDTQRQQLTDIWRAVACATELEQLWPRLAHTMGQTLALRAFVLRALDLERSALVTLASWQERLERARIAPHFVLEQDQLEDLLGFCKAGQLEENGPNKHAPRAHALALKGFHGAVLTAPLARGDEPLGIVQWVMQDDARVGGSQRTQCAQWAEACAIALVNARRVRGLAALRETAEADKRSLLTRLGRTEISDAIIGAEAGLRPLLERIGQVAGSDVPVLLLGETGSGKEVAARAIHNRSSRRERAFLRVNCGAIPQQLIDSELFGHERGSFTGATGGRAGWFERADQGTLFLDEVGELPLEAQVRLLRVLQDGTFERVGGERSMRVDVRIVAATHRDLSAMIEEERFRRDLWYRIAVFPIHIPPLRERIEDIPALATHFALKASRRLGTAPRSPTPDDIELLLSYAWPGNVRELASVMERAVLLGNGQSLEVRLALGASFTRGSVRVRDVPSARSAARPAAFAHAGPQPAGEERAAIEHALRSSLGRVEGPFGAARRLGLNPNTLRSKLRRMGIDTHDFRAPQA